MKVFDFLCEKGFPKLTFKLLLVFKNGDSIVIAPPNKQSFILGKDFSYSRLFRTEEFLLYSKQQLEQVEKIFFITIVSLKDIEFILTKKRMVRECISEYRNILSKNPEHFDVFDVLAVFSIKRIIEGLGYLNVDASINQLNSIRNYLAVKSNDFSLLDFIWKKVFQEDLTDFEAMNLIIKKCNHNLSHSVSVVIPCYESNETIQNTIESILLSLSHLPKKASSEIILVDDSRTLGSKFKHEKVKIISSNFRLNCGGARNIGISVSKGQTIFLIDSDTYIAENYIANHLLRHSFFPNLLLVSMREPIKLFNTPKQHPRNHLDTRMGKSYEINWKTLNNISKPISVKPLQETDKFKNFGYGRKLGPTDLPFMVKGNNLSFTRLSVGSLLFCNSYQGWGPEDVSFAANLICKGFFVVPILSTGVFHVEHAPRSGSIEQKEKELELNLKVHNNILNGHPYETW